MGRVPNNIKKLNQYKGPLTPSEAAEGMNAAPKNARRLVEDADYLLTARRFASAASLAILAIEEAGKVSILRSLTLARSDDETVAEWKAYRAHTEKNRLWLLPQIVATGARKLTDFNELVADAEHAYLLDQLKQLGFYTDCLGNKHWSNPEDVVDEKLAKSLVRTARLLSGGGPISVLEVELWVKHLQPVWRKSLKEMQQALIGWYADLQRHGLAPPGPNQMEAFVRGGLKVEGERKT